MTRLSCSLLLVLTFLWPVAACSATTFDLLELDIDGNTVLGVRDIEKAVYPFLGEKRTIADVEAARTALEKVYHDNGYLTVLVDIPEQKVENGLVHLRVTEATVERVRVTGSRYYSLGYIRATVPSLAEGSVPNFQDAQKDLGLLNRTPDRQVTPVLRAGEVPGTVDVELKVADELPLHGSVQYDNRYSADTTHTRLTASARYDNLFQRDQSLSFQYMVAPERPSDAEAYSLSYVIPTSTGRAYALYGVRSDSNVASLGNLGVVGKGDIVGLRVVQPLPPLQDYSHTFTFGADWKHFGQSVLLLGSDSVASPVTYMPFILQYTATAAEGGAAQSGTSSTQFDGSINFLVRGLVNSETEFADRRYGASNDYIYFRGTLQRTQVLPASFSLVGRLQGQVASEPLISSEQIAAGGADTVRGYTEFERLGDDGMIYGVELRSPSLLGDLPGPRNSLYGLIFWEGANLRVRQALPGQLSTYALSSVGLGLRLRGWHGLSVDLDWAHVFTDAQVTTAGESRVLFMLNYAF